MQGLDPAVGPRMPVSKNNTVNSMNYNANLIKPKDGSNAKENLANEKIVEDQTQVDESTNNTNKEQAEIIPMDRVKKMGNIDAVRKRNKAELEKELEEIKSIHEMDNAKPFNAIMNTDLHVTIDEKKCKLYETYDEPTVDDEVEDQLI
ncbi:unnamed protein product [Thelazia callipaeda]|uniref:EB1 C-terminal domain-containing protein n=1 Tax=Thelazia callipaeda TaxID=103827 RepID=A0A0N5D4G9_THECL|nr:unnamed protein product [Thelazia callipaeda]